MIFALKLSLTLATLVGNISVTEFPAYHRKVGVKVGLSSQQAREHV